MPAGSVHTQIYRLGVADVCLCVTVQMHISGQMLNDQQQGSDGITRGAGNLNSYQWEMGQVDIMKLVSLCCLGR